MLPNSAEDLALLGDAAEAQDSGSRKNFAVVCLGLLLRAHMLATAAGVS